MERQVYAKDPATGVYRHQYVWIGKGQVDRVRGSAVVPAANVRNDVNTGRKIGRAAA